MMIGAGERSVSTSGPGMEVLDALVDLAPSPQSVLVQEWYSKQP